MAIVHSHPRGPEHVLALYGWDGLDFHLKVAHEVDNSGEMDEHEQDAWHDALHRVAVPLEDSGDEDHLVDPELLADALGPVPVEQFFLRTRTCDTCAALAGEPVGPESEAAIREHVFKEHYHQVVWPTDA